jgi:hypothetical protein
MVDRILRRRDRWRSWIAPVTAAATVVLALTTVATSRREVATLKSATAAVERRNRALADSLSSILGAERIMQQTIARAGYQGGVLIFYDEDTKWWNVAVHDLPPARSDEVYQLWFVTRTGVQPGPELHPDGSRPTFVTFSRGPQVADPVAVELTVEPLSGRDARPVGTEIARVSF